MSVMASLLPSRLTRRRSVEKPCTRWHEPPRCRGAADRVALPAARRARSTRTASRSLCARATRRPRPHVRLQRRGRGRTCGRRNIRATDLRRQDLDQLFSSRRKRRLRARDAAFDEDVENAGVGPSVGAAFTAMRTSSVAPTPNTSWPRKLTAERLRRRSTWGVFRPHEGARARVRARRGSCPQRWRFPRRSLRGRAHNAPRRTRPGLPTLPASRPRSGRATRSGCANATCRWCPPRRTRERRWRTPARWRTRAGRPRDQRRRETWRSSRGRLLAPPPPRPWRVEGSAERRGVFCVRPRSSVHQEGRRSRRPFIAATRGSLAHEVEARPFRVARSRRSPWDDAMTTSAKMARRTRPRRRSPRASTRRPPRPAASVHRSLEETNRVREKLGLKPLRTGESDRAKRQREAEEQAHTARRDAGVQGDRRDRRRVERNATKEKRRSREARRSRAGTARRGGRRRGRPERVGDQEPRHRAEEETRGEVARRRNSRVSSQSRPDYRAGALRRRRVFDSRRRVSADLYTSDALAGLRVRHGADEVAEGETAGAHPEGRQRTGRDADGRQRRGRDALENVLRAEEKRRKRAREGAPSAPPTRRSPRRTRARDLCAHSRKVRREEGRRRVDAERRWLFPPRRSVGRRRSGGGSPRASAARPPVPANRARRLRRRRSRSF